MCNVARVENVVSIDFASTSLTAGQLNEIVEKLGGHDAALRFLRDEFVVFEQIRRWREVDGVIYLTVTLDNPTLGDEWISRTEMKGNRAGDCVKSVLRSKKFMPSVAGTYEVAILRGLLVEDSDRTTQNIRAKAKEMNFRTPNADIACLIREQFTDEEIEAMGLSWIVTMHEPIEDAVRDPNFLTVRLNDGGRWLDVCGDYPGNKWGCETGFMFLAPQADHHLVL